MEQLRPLFFQERRVAHPIPSQLIPSRLFSPLQYPNFHVRRDRISDSHYNGRQQHLAAISQLPNPGVCVCVCIVVVGGAVVPVSSRAVVVSSAAELELAPDPVRDQRDHMVG